MNIVVVSKTHSVTFLGVTPQQINVEAQLSPGLPGFSLVGLADKAVNESRERIRAAFYAIGLALPAKRITVNLAPAHIQKEGSYLDLPIAAVLLSAMDVIPKDQVSEALFMGELSLSGSLNAVTGILPAAIFAHDKNLSFFCPSVCSTEAAWSGHDKVYLINDLKSLINHFKKQPISQLPQQKFSLASNAYKQDMKDVRGQVSAKRALEIAAAGGHNLLMIGPPGSGKSMLASRLPSILPPLNAREALEVTTIHSLAGTLPKSGLIHERPYQAPHHSASMPAIIGGGYKCLPGEVSLAHRGVLFLDELPEFSRIVLESLRQPIENGTVAISRANAHVEYPAQVQLIAAMNPCKCGYFSYDENRECKRVPICAQDYQNKISGPLYDRFDMSLYITPVPVDELKQRDAYAETSAIIRKRVMQARSIQAERVRNHKLTVDLNALLQGEDLEKACKLQADSQDLLARAAHTLKVSNRAYFRIIRVARTIADLANCETIAPDHIKEALNFRQTHQAK